MKKLSLSKSAVTALAFAASSALFLGGCNNVGDENPISPEKMEQIRQQEGKQRENFNPDMSAPKG